jgi:hypothetical protein
MNGQTAQERRRVKRRNIPFYFPIQDNNTHKVIGHLVDISPIGLLMDSRIPIQPNLEFHLHLEFMELVAGKAFLDFNARSKWCHPDSILPDSYNAGFEITHIAPEDIIVLKSIAEKYGAH